MRLLDCLQGNAGLDAGNARQTQQALHHQLGKHRQIGNHDTQHVVRVATDGEAVRDFRHGRDGVFKGPAGRIVVSFEDHLGKSGDPQAERRGGKQRDIAGDDAIFLEPLDAATDL
ncbi:MAG: hypothetical protein CAPSK01_002600 [Candidatus Accumulibacter vicinus]|uniref:Uncharacterized protein n=1 Tax=Candidatus Accumulibacter vicinus TaxID=2954382 RepID=A0A084XZW4_9PROT|nr:MAG: hypothetical protein CAPSK01_002600 [Candidatus Accumulibacter vicinus]